MDSTVNVANVGSLPFIRGPCRDTSASGVAVGAMSFRVTPWSFAGRPARPVGSIPRSGRSTAEAPRSRRGLRSLRNPLGAQGLLHLRPLYLAIARYASANATPLGPAPGRYATPMRLAETRGRNAWPMRLPDACPAPDERLDSAPVTARFPAVDRIAIRSPSKWVRSAASSPQPGPRLRGDRRRFNPSSFLELNSSIRFCERRYPLGLGVAAATAIRSPRPRPKTTEVRP